MEVQSTLENVVSDRNIMAALLSGTLCKFAGMALISRRQQRQSERFELVGKVSDLLFHPVTSCRGIHAKDALCTDVGLEKDGTGDRRWMILGPEGNKINMKAEPKLTLVKCHSQGDIMRLTAPGMEPLDLPKRPDWCEDNLRWKTLHEQPIKVIDCGKKVNDWFSEYLQREVQIIHAREELDTRCVYSHVRPWENTARRGDKTLLNFLTAYLLTTTASLKEINDQLTKPVGMDNFRPNIVVDNSIPFDEDNWDEIRIGKSISFHSVEPCRRCIITTIDPDTAEMDKDMQPLKLLRSFRCRPPYGQACPLFGVYISNDSNGRIQIGDPVYVKRKPLATPPSKELKDQ